jgi:hypothetical protein
MIVGKPFEKFIFKISAIGCNIPYFLSTLAFSYNALLNWTKTTCA